LTEIYLILKGKDLIYIDRNLLPAILIWSLIPQLERIHPKDCYLDLTFIRMV